MLAVFHARAQVILSIRMLEKECNGLTAEEWNEELEDMIQKCHQIPHATIFFFVVMHSAVRVQRACWKTTKATQYVARHAHVGRRRFRVS